MNSNMLHNSKSHSIRIFPGAKQRLHVGQIEKLELQHGTHTLLFLALIALFVRISIVSAQPLPDSFFKAWVHREAAQWTKETAQRAKEGAVPPQPVAIDSRGNIIVTYSVSDDGTKGDSDYYIAKCSASSGVLLWEKHMNGPGSAGSLPHLVIDSRDNVIVSVGPHTAKYAAAEGAVLWEKLELAAPWSAAVAIDHGDNVILTWLSLEGPVTCHLAKYDGNDGRTLWVSNVATGWPNAMTIDRSNNVAVTGQFIPQAHGNGLFVRKYAGETGQLAWERNQIRSINFVQPFVLRGPDAVAADSSGNILVADYDYTGEHGTSFYVAKYGGGDGATLWEYRREGALDLTPGFYDGLSDEAEAVAVDRAGNVLVTGRLVSGDVDAFGEPVLESYTVKLGGSDGRILWERTAQRDHLWGWGLTVDGDGNAVIMGQSLGEVHNGNCYTIKYAGATGVKLWERDLCPDGFEKVQFGLAQGPGGVFAVSSGSFDGPDRQTFTYATTLYRENLSPVLITRTASSVRLHITGRANANYTIERAPSVVGPWTVLTVVTTSGGGTDGTVDYSDPDPPADSAFYRISTAEP